MRFRKTTVVSWLTPSLSASLESLDLELQPLLCVADIPRALNRTLLHGGKKIRPALCFLMGQLYGFEATQLAPFARAAELLHCATLAHDDVIDEATLRRNQPTLNVQTSNAHAVLAGDLLLARVVAEVAALGDLGVVLDLSYALEDLVQGEWLQLEHRGNAVIERERLELVAIKKTGSLMSWCCAIPARLKKMPEPHRARCVQLGNRVGLAFQMRDDLLDLIGEGDKNQGQDLREGLVNFLVLELLDLYPDLKPAVADLLNKPTPKTLPWSADQLNLAGEGLGRRLNDQLRLAQEDLDQLLKEVPYPHAPAAATLAQILKSLKALSGSSRCHS